MKSMKLTAATVFGILILAGPSAGAQQGYSSWIDPNAAKKAEASLGALVRELDDLVTGAEKARAADPKFLRDLRDLVRRYDAPEQTRLFGDDFADGDYTSNPSWVVASGRFWVEKGYGLRYDAKAASAPQPPVGRKESGQDMAKQVLGAFLGQVLQPQGQSGGQAPTPVASSGPASIYLAHPLPNAYRLTLEVTSWQAEGGFETGPYQGANREGGYRLAYRSGATPSLELLRASSQGTGVVDKASLPASLEDRAAHVVEWSRTAFGEMTVAVDGRQVLKATDLDFKDAFGGVVFSGLGGDVVLRRIEVFGAQ